MRDDTLSFREFTKTLDIDKLQINRILVHEPVCYDDNYKEQIYLLGTHNIYCAFDLAFSETNPKYFNQRRGHISSASISFLSDFCNSYGKLPLCRVTNETHFSYS